MKKYLIDFTVDDARQLIKNNQAVERAIIEEINDSAQYWVDEYLTGCPAKSYQIGTWCQGEHFTLDADQLEKFSSWFEGVQHDYCFLNDNDAEIVRAYINGSENLKDDVNKIIYDRLQLEYDNAFNIDVQIDYFFFMVDERECFSGKKYVTKEYTNIYEDIPEIIIPAHTEKIM